MGREGISDRATDSQALNHITQKTSVAIWKGGGKYHLSSMNILNRKWDLLAAKIKWKLGHKYIRDRGGKCHREELGKEGGEEQEGGEMGMWEGRGTGSE